MNLGRFAIDTVTLSGTLEDKLRVTRDAGFGGIEIWAKDLVTHPGGVPGAVAAIRASGLRVSSFQLLKDYEGLDAHLHEYKFEIARSLMDLVEAVGSTVLVVASSTSPYATGDIDHVAADLAKLAQLAAPRDIRIAFGAPAWARWISEYPATSSIPFASATMPESTTKAANHGDTTTSPFASAMPITPIVIPSASWSLRSLRPSRLPMIEPPPQAASNIPKASAPAPSARAKGSSPTSTMSTAK